MPDSHLTITHGDKPGLLWRSFRLPGLVVLLLLVFNRTPSAEAQSSDGPLSAIEVEYAEWGFDDRAIPRAFNLLSISMRNTTEKPFDGTLRLRRIQGVTGSWTGAEILEPVYINPYGTKQFSFYPYLLDSSDDFELRWGESLNDSYVIERPALGNGARVLFNNREVQSGVTLGLRGFREELFPTSVTGTGELRIAVLDHLPRWESAQRLAFRDWLFQGGVLHVLYQSDRTFPDLPVPELNVTPDGKHPAEFGAGRIFWHERTRTEVSREYAYDKIYPTSLPLVSVAGSGGFPFDVDPTAGDFYTEPELYYEATTEWNSDDLLFRAMRAIVAPAHNWTLFYSLSVFYILLIFPGGALLARSKLDYRLNLLALLLLVATFGWLFSRLGARGYGERTSTYALAIAHPVSDGRWQIHQHDSLFAAEGNNYSITHSGESLVYSTAQDDERVDGIINCGVKGSFTVDVPQFTFRTFAHETQTPLGNWNLQISQIGVDPVPIDPDEMLEILPPLPPDPDDEDSDDLEWEFDLLRQTLSRDDPLRLNSLQINQTGSLPETIHAAFVLYSGTIYPIGLDELRAGSGNILSGEPERIASYIRLLDRRRLYEGRLRRIGPERTLDELLHWLLAEELRIRMHSDTFRFRLPPNRIRLYLYADLPSELSSRELSAPEQPLGTQAGRILYCLEQTVPGDGLHTNGRE